MISITYETEAATTDRTTGERALSAGLRTLVFDAVITSSPETTAELTDRAVEGGASSDHKKLNQRLISVDAWVSNTPLGAPPSGGLDAPVSADATRDPDTDANVIAFTESFDRVRGVFDELDRLVRSPTSLTLSTPTQEYEDVQLVSVSAPMSSETGTDAALFSMSFVEVNVVETRLGDAPVPREPRGARHSNAGDQNGAEAEAADGSAEAENNQSTLAWLWGQAGG